MPKDLVDSFRSGDELTANLLDAILRELKRLRKMVAVPPLGISNSDGMTPPVLYLRSEDTVVPFQAPSAGVAAGTIASPTTFTATLLYSTSPGTFTDTSAPTTTLGRHFMDMAIPGSANGWAIWRDGYLWPVYVADMGGMKLAQSGGGGIAARSSTTPGSGTVTLQSFNGSTLSAGSTVTAYNLAGTAVGASKYIMITSIGGYWFVDFEDC